ELEPGQATQRERRRDEGWTRGGGVSQPGQQDNRTAQWGRPEERQQAHPRAADEPVSNGRSFLHREFRWRSARQLAAGGGRGERRRRNQARQDLVHGPAADDSGDAAAGAVIYLLAQVSCQSRPRKSVTRPSDWKNLLGHWN